MVSGTMVKAVGILNPIHSGAKAFKPAVIIERTFYNYAYNLSRKLFQACRLNQVFLCPQYN